MKSNNGFLQETVSISADTQTLMDTDDNKRMILQVIRWSFRHQNYETFPILRI